MSVKRKAEDGPAAEDDTHGSTLFISNLSYDTTTEGLQAAFSDIAPIRSCFIVYEKPSEGDAPGPGKSKGVGYVTFAVKEDAEATAKVYNVDAEGGAKPLVIDGRKVRVKWADRKPTLATDPSAVPATPVVKKPRKEPRKSIVPAVNDPDAIRTLAITNLPSGLTNAALWKKVRKYDGAESVVWPVGDDSGLAHAIFKTPAKAAAALPKLHSHVYKGSVLSVILKKRVDSLVKNVTSSKSSTGGQSTKLGPNRGGRIIVRNLPWNITEADLRTLFTPCGPIHSITLPTTPSPNPDKPPLARGFAFIWFLSKPDAARAIMKVNGAKVYGGFATDKAAEKANKIVGRKEVSRKKAEEGAREVAVDWAVSKERWEEGLGDEASEGESEDTGSASGSDEDGAVGVHEDESSASGSGSDDGSNDGDDASIQEDAKDRSGPPPPPEEGCTLFVRNVPFEATDDDLRILFRAFGPLRYTRITMDHDSGRSRGTGFACFWNLADADKCVEEAERMKADLDPDMIAKKNPFTLLTLDPSSSRAARLVLQGRTLDVSRAVSRTQADKLREVGERVRERKDTRNLYLMREGVIFPSTPSAATLAPAELERRQQAYDARRTLLRSNPSLYISRTRLSVRQLPTFVSERVLKRLAMHAVRAFEDEVKSGERAPLGDDERDENNAAGDPLQKPEDNKSGKPVKKSTFWKKGERKTGVKQAKIVRQGDRVDPLTGKGRSKGYGFLEMERHEDALRVLRWANNNRQSVGMMWTWWNEELVDLAERTKKDIKSTTGSPDGKGKDGDDRETLEARLKRQLAKLEEMGTGGRPSATEEGGKDGRTLLIEFSIENVQVVKRRSGKEEEAREGGGRGSDRKGKTDSSAPNTKSTTRGKDPARKPSKQVAEASNDDVGSKGVPSTTSASQKPKTKKDKVLGTDGKKSGHKLGGIIGKKRKERKAKAGGK